MDRAFITSFLTAMSNIVKLQNAEYKRIGAEYGLTAIDVSIIVFLENNPTKQSASDIVELKHLAKGNVSKSIETLSKKGFIKIIPDISDKRRKNLILLEPSREIIEKAFAMYESYEDIFGINNEMFMKSVENIIKAGEKARNALGEINE